MSANHREALIASTKQAAVAFLEDMEHIRALIQADGPQNMELRLLSVTLRRLLVNDELSKVASGRIGRIKIRAPDFKDAYVKQRNNRINYFIGAEAPLFNSQFRSVSAAFFPQPPTKAMIKEMSDIEPQTQIDLSTDSFMKQKVVFLIGRWLTRNQIIKHAAIYGSAAHSATPETAEELIVARLRNSFVVELNDDGYAVHLDEYLNSDNPQEKAKFVHREGVYDGIQIQLLGTAYCLANSPDIMRLEDVIRAELR